MPDFQTPARYVLHIEEGGRRHAIEVAAERLVFEAGRWLLDGRPLVLHGYEVGLNTTEEEGL